MDKFEKKIWAMYVAIVLVNIVFIGVIIWGIIKLVNHFAG